MSDQISIHNLVLFSSSGITPQEQQVGQKFLVNCTMHLDIHRASRNDDLRASVHCGVIAQLLTDVLQQESCQLIETAAQRMAEAVLQFDPAIQSVDIELTKPWTHLAYPMDDVSVKITRSWHTAYIGLGSNMGDRKAYLDQALEGLRNTDQILVDRCSQWMEAAPYGYTQQDPFLNGVVKLRTLLTPYALLERLRELEKAANKEMRIHWGPRTLDLDILFYDDAVIQEEDLCIPHYDLQNRDFVLVPMVEIAPYFHHPITGKTMTEMLQDLTHR